jgi:hypothetical protein
MEREVEARPSDLTFFGRINLNPNIALRLPASFIERNDRTIALVREYPEAKPPGDHTPSAASFFNRTYPQGTATHHRHQTTRLGVVIKR